MMIILVFAVLPGPHDLCFIWPGFIIYNLSHDVLCFRKQYTNMHQKKSIMYVRLGLKLVRLNWFDHD